MKLSFKKSISNLLFLYKYIRKYAFSYFLHECLYQIYAAVELFFEFTFGTKFFIDLITSGGDFRFGLIYLGILVAAIMCKIAWAGVIQYKILPGSIANLQKNMQEELFVHAIRMDLSKYDDPKYYNDFVWSVNEINTRSEAVIRDFSSLLNAVVTILISGVFIVLLDVAGLLFVVAGLVFTMLINIYATRMRFQLDQDTNPIKRKRNYFNRIFYLQDYAKEIRLNPVAERLQEEFHNTNNEMIPVVKKYGKKIAITTALSNIIFNSFFQDVAYLGYLLYRVMVRHTISFGTLLGLYSATWDLRQHLTLFSELFPKMQAHSMYLEKVRSFLSFEPEVKSGEKRIFPDQFRELSIDNVSFGYDPEKPTLKNISMTVKAGEKIAIVGYNGAGKSTLCKLILRLYDSDSGKICINGENIQDFKTDDYRDLYSSIFQDYKLYAASIAENVKMDIVGDSDNSNIETALVKSGFQEKLDELEQGLGTQITKEFEETGVGLSGGEAQKVAVARVFSRSAPIIIMDEPSAALDPVSEYRLNEIMLDAVKEKTVLYISHRLTSTKSADRIYMFENGEIIESGNHDELMKQNKKYAQMFRMQAERYIIKE